DDPVRCHVSHPFRRPDRPSLRDLWLVPRRGVVYAGQDAVGLVLRLFEPRVGLRRRGDARRVFDVGLLLSADLVFWRGVDSSTAHAARVADGGAAQLVSAPNEILPFECNSYAANSLV